jgi:hypothetical protein
MLSVPDPAIIAQAMRKGHKIRSMLDDDNEVAQLELFFAMQYQLFDHEPPEDPDQSEGSSDDGGGP